jgi:hypothetical protein
MTSSSATRFSTITDFSRHSFRLSPSSEPVAFPAMIYIDIVIRAKNILSGWIVGFRRSVSK